MEVEGRRLGRGLLKGRNGGGCLTLLILVLLALCQSALSNESTWVLRLLMSKLRCHGILNLAFVVL
jgi:hypothetical protein